MKIQRARRGMGCQCHSFTPEKKNRYPFYRRLGGPQGEACTGVGNFVRDGLRSPDRPASKESLYQLRYAGPTHEMVPWVNSLDTVTKYRFNTREYEYLPSNEVGVITRHS